MAGIVLEGVAKVYDGGVRAVDDWVYASTDRIHCLVFGVGPQGAYRHSEEFRTIFGADEYLHVLEGELILANPETGDVVRVPEGQVVAELGPEDAMYVPMGSSYDIRNVGGTTCRLVFGVAPKYLA